MKAYRRLYISICVPKALKIMRHNPTNTSPKPSPYSTTDATTFIRPPNVFIIIPTPSDPKYSSPTLTNDGTTSTTTITTMNYHIKAHHDTGAAGIRSWSPPPPLWDQQGWGGMACHCRCSGLDVLTSNVGCETPFVVWEVSVLRLIVAFSAC